jgi:hypothetical protein
MNYLDDMVQRCCKIYFKTVNPSNIHFHFTGASYKIDGKKRIMGIEKINGKKVTIQVDRHFANDADESSITAKLAHELAHIKLNHPVRTTYEQEKAAENEVQKFFNKWIKS